MVKLFGKSLFEHEKPLATMYDFAQHGLLRGSSNDYGMEYVTVQELTQSVSGSKKKKPAAKKKEAPKKTPKELYELKTLNVPTFAINCDPAYIDEEVGVLNDKLGIYGPEPKPEKRRRRPRNPEAMLIGDNGEYGSTRYGRMEVKSMIDRLRNRKNFSEADFTEWPYTTTQAVQELVKNHPHLEAKKVMENVPDLPKEAVKAIKQYQELCATVANAKPVFYLIAEKANREDVGKRRDPILLAQSPYGFFWQILGAWDKEVVFLEEL